MKEILSFLLLVVSFVVIAIAFVIISIYNLYSFRGYFKRISRNYNNFLDSKFFATLANGVAWGLPNL